MPISRADMQRLGWDQLDILLVTGDAYVDHPSFGAALLGRWLLDNGYRVGIVAQPRWDSPADVLAMGRPRLFAGVTAGSLDSMLAHYTAFRKKRSDDAYTPGGLSGSRPNRAAIVYTSLVKQAFKGLPVVLGGVEASLRRVSHFDFWTDKLRRSILLDSKATALVYGMAERTILTLAKHFDSAESERQPLAHIPGCVSLGSRGDIPAGSEIVELPSIEQMQQEPSRLMTATLAIEKQVHQRRVWAVEPTDSGDLILPPPAAPLGTDELDRLYGLGFTRCAHPDYTETVPAEQMIHFSITSHRGCGGGCSFCALAQHQGRNIRSRSENSIAAEIEQMTHDPQWRGSISDIGGPSANMWGAVCGADVGSCNRSSCLHPNICPHFIAPQDALAEMLGRLSNMDGVKHLRIASGVRYDLAAQSERYTRELIEHFVGGQLKLAPEHTVARVLKAMRKPAIEKFTEFLAVFEQISSHAGKKQYVIPYLMTAFPGCSESDMRQLADWLASRNWRPQQVQCFIPLPMTVAAAMYYAGIDADFKAIKIARSDAERMKQHAVLTDFERRRETGNNNRSQRRTPSAGKNKRFTDERPSRRRGNGRRR